MGNRETPEVDAVVDALIPHQFLPQELIDIARRLERQRDGLVEALERIVSLAIAGMKPLDGEKFEEIKQARAAFKSVKGE